MTTLSLGTIQESEGLMKKLFILLSLLMMSSVFAQEPSDADQYPEMDMGERGISEFPNPHGLPPLDDEDVSRQEQEYVPEHSVSDEIPPEEIYDSDEEYLE